MSDLKQFTLSLENDRLLNGVDFYEFCCNSRQQKIKIVVNNEGHCLEHAGVYNILDRFEFDSVEIETSNVLEQHLTHVIDKSRWLQWFTSINYYDDNFDFTWTGHKRFGVIYGRPTAPRLGIAAHLQQHHVHSSVLITRFDYANEDMRKLFDLQRLFAWHPPSVYQLGCLEHMPQEQFPYQRAGLYDYSNPLYKQYQSFLIDIVAEPVYEGRSFYPTEKIVRPILYQRPFIVMATRNYLQYLRDMGFYTFSEFWDEDYDGFDGKDRFLKILNLIDRLASLSQQQMMEIYNDSRYFIQHNFNLLKDHAYSKKLGTYD